MAAAVAEIDGVTWSYRSDTNDLGIIEQVFSNNACNMPDKMGGWLVLDIGAHIGAAAGLAASRGARVLAYEPSSSSYRRLIENVFTNRWDIKPSNLGVGSGGIKKLYLDKYNTGQNSEFLLYPELDSDIFEFMRTITLAQAMPSGRDCNFLKLDCEGCEEVVIDEIADGLYQRIHRIFVEFHCSTKQQYIDKLSKIYTPKFLGYGYMFER